MQYILLVYDTTSLPEWNNLPNAEKRQLSDETYVWYAELEKAGKARGVNRLDLPATAATVRGSANGVGVTDGPFTETKEMLGGYVIVECRDRAEAIEIAKTFPGLRYHFAVEVREVLSEPVERKRWTS